MEKSQIIARLPYSDPFLFVDDIVHIDENGVEGHYTLMESLAFYKGHFKTNPVTPGVILTEIMAQIGVVSLGIFLLDKNFTTSAAIALTSMETEFFKPVFPNEKVTDFSKKIYFRFGKLKCSVRMVNATGETVCSGMISGMITTKPAS